MRKKQNKMTGPFLIIFSLLVIALLSYNSNAKKKNRNKYLEENGVYTTAKVIEYGARTYGTNGGSSAFIKIEYIVNAKVYKIESDYYVPEKNGPKEGELFMAMYLPNEPEKCALLYDYPVKDSSDYKRYIEEFKKNPPKLK